MSPKKLTFGSSYQEVLGRHGGPLVSALDSGSNGRTGMKSVDNSRKVGKIPGCQHDFPGIKFAFPPVTNTSYCTSLPRFRLWPGYCAFSSQSCIHVHLSQLGLAHKEQVALGNPIKSSVSNIMHFTMADLIGSPLLDSIQSNHVSSEPFVSHAPGTVG